MYDINIKVCDNTKVFIFNGAIDSNVTDEIKNFVESNSSSSDSVIFDMEKVPYMSSAGLRVVLKTAKSVKEFEVINASVEL